MPFTLDSMEQSRYLERPRIGDVYDVAIDTSYIKSIPNNSIKEKQFQVIWPGHNHYFVDPVIELFIPLRKRYREEYDLHIGLDAVHSESSEGIMVYRFVCGTFKRRLVDTRVVESELDFVAPRILSDLDSLFQTWAEADNGLCAYLKEQNVASIHAFLESIGMRDPDGPTPEELAAKKAAEKEARRAAHFREHPEHAK